MDHFFEGIGNAVHLIAAFAWIGGLALLVVGIRPVFSRHISDASERDRLYGVIHRRFFLVASCSAAILLASGFMMMTTNEQFEGFGHYENTWSKLLVAKHVLFFGMLGILIALRKPKPAKAERDLLDISLMLGLGVLVITGLLTASR